MPDHSINWKRFLAGLFFIGGVLLVSFMIFTIGKSKGLTQPKFQITVLFNDVGGLLEGAPIRLSGVSIGNVAGITFLDQEVHRRRVKVVCNIFTQFKAQLNKNAIFKIQTEGVLGEKLIEIVLLEEGPPLNLDAPILGQDPLDVTDLAMAFTEAAQSFTKTSDSISSIEMDELASQLGETAKSLSATAKGINSVLQELQYLTRKSKRLINRVEQKLIDGNLFKVF
ncbi:MAG: MCE family protein [Candidatus Omnitrophica bacterium]|nr:MCE family protein [Candidatus Omnitrophota bacterium]